jgi:hypothetical protein
MTPLVKPEDAAIDCTLFRELQIFLRVNFSLGPQSARKLAVRFMHQWKDGDE